MTVYTPSTLRKSITINWDAVRRRFQYFFQSGIAVAAANFDDLNPYFVSHGGQRDKNGKPVNFPDTVSLVGHPYNVNRILLIFDNHIYDHSF